MTARTSRLALALAVLATGVLTAPAMAQRTIGVAAHYTGYSFDEGLGAEAAQLLLYPVALRLPLGDKLRLDVSSAWAQGKVERDGVQFTLQGVTDTRVKLSYNATPWALVSVGATLPSGDATNDAEEAVVTSVLATDLLGFREATLGSGPALTTSVATATRIGAWGVGLAGAYSVRGEFEPSADADLTYRPGNETRIRVGLDRNIGTNTFTAGATFRTYTADQARGRNLFQAGNRFRVDATYAFRAGAGVWTIYAADVIRENGDLTLDIVDAVGSVVGDTTIVTAKQNLAVAGFVGSVGLGGGFVFRPHVDFRYQKRTEPDGADRGSGWLVAAGGDLPLRVFGAYDFFPKARILVGSIKDVNGVGVRLLGAELSGTVRWSF